MTFLVEYKNPLAIPIRNRRCSGCSNLYLIIIVMKKYFSCLFISLVLLGCSAEKAPLPALSYTGVEPRIQDPLSPEDSQKHIQLPQGFEAVLYAAEPNIINPIAFSWDERGRLWVVQSMDYPHGLDNDVGGDRITICEDTDGDGLADKFTDFATEQSLTTGIINVKGGVIVAQAPEIYYLQDTDGDDIMDKRTELVTGFGTYDTHAGPSNLKYGIDNLIWGSVGYSGFESQFDGETINFTRGVFKFSPDGEYFEPIGQFNNNTWGLGFTQDFEIFGSTANNNHCCYVGIPLRHYDYLNELPSWAINADFIQGHYEIFSPDTIPLQQVDVRGGYTAAAGANFYTADNYPSEYQNQMYVNEPTGHLVHLAKIEEDGAGYKEVDGGNIFASTDAWTAPVHTETGPDGNLWVADWYNPVIQHNPDKRGMDNQIWNDERGEGNAHLNPHRDKGHGRIYIIKHKKGKKSKINSLDPSDLAGLMEGLRSDNMFWRTTAQRLIVENNLQDLVPELVQLAEKDARGLNAGAMHALWTLKGLGAESDTEVTAAIESALSNNSDAVRKAGIALLPNDLAGTELLVKSGLLESDNLHVRLAAILRASELPETDALSQTLQKISLDPTNLNDQWLNAAVKIYFREQNYESVDKELVETVIPAADEESSEWKYTFEQPAQNWSSPDFDDSDWRVGQSVFGTESMSDQIRTTWNSEDIWLRKEVVLEDLIDDPVLKVMHDENYRVYVNGEMVFKDKGTHRGYNLIRLGKSVGPSFKKGKNIIAVYCHNEHDRQFIDVGIGQVKKIKPDQIISLNTVPQKMAFDQTVLYAMAGEEIEISLTNKDEMPHNLVLIEEGSLESFGALVDKFLQNPDAEKMQYVPESRYVLAATDMLDPGKQEVIRLRVPDKPGDYPFICTFPGHWRMMQGVLKVSARGSYASADPNAPKIAVMGGGGSHDFLKYFGVADGKILSENGINEVNYTESSLELEKMLPAADLLVISNNKAFDASTRDLIFSKVNDGMPMMIYHPSTWYNWQDWPEYNRQLVGGGSKSHEKLQEFEVRVTKSSHPIMQGVPSTFRITDELYRWEKDPEGTDIEVLAVGRGLESGAEFPVVWIVKHGKAKIVCNTLGHDQDAHSLPAYQKILSNSLKWLKRDLVRPTM